MDNVKEINAREVGRTYGILATIVAIIAGFAHVTNVGKK